ncbi:hypothetical protein NOS3756_37420 [Nostoc sp. NIES-3756]|uniref:DUF11 domain-containing protein n=1 Tax=Nostoc sp. NIES-3756 TaxID=1751286 RepID=UPI0007219480|nr:DUF11 domain-containing protein [Nostoc sp. NIES-3756]BAT54769.1 hypothetical protein NOS3756_37420 [Nostoc sp. NIES-3756]
MIRPHKKKQFNFGNNWFQRLTTTVIIGSFLHTTLTVPATAQDAGFVGITNQATYTYSYEEDGKKIIYQQTTEQININPGPLVDPLGRILGCGGTLLPDYTGFSVAVYEPNPNDPTGTELGQLVSLTRTEVPDIANNNIPGGLAPNTENSNPYFITNNPPGVYNFLLDPNRGQTNPGRTYIFVVNPPSDSIYQQRRIKIQILDSTNINNNNIVRYVATSLDGQPIRTTGETRVEDRVVLVPNAELVGLDLLAFEFTTNMCQPNQVQLIKTGDRAAAEPGDTVIYRLSVKNLSDVTLNNVVITDSLPFGFNFIPKSVRGEINGQTITLTPVSNGNNITLRTNANLPVGQVVNIAYAAQLTADAIRGTGRNSAIVNAQRTDNGFRTKDGPATHLLKIRPGIVADCGTIIGRVFEDKNFDGEQQPGEPGIANAVIFLQDGNRITTDPKGLFSLANVLPGSHVGVLDLSSVPGYQLAPNKKFKERNSQSRLVRLEPGGLVRMNFAVTPTSQEVMKP